MVLGPRTHAKQIGAEPSALVSKSLHKTLSGSGARSSQSFAWSWSFLFSEFPPSCSSCPPCRAAFTLLLLLVLYVPNFTVRFRHLVHQDVGRCGDTLA